MAGKRKKYGRNQPREAVITAPHLPHKVVVLIISRLPVKSLCRFRCVSKSWFSTISTPQFAKTHLDLAFQNNTQSQKLIWFLSYGLRRNIYCVDWDSINDDDVRDKGLVAVELGHSLKDNPIFSRIHRIPHSSNGLLCVICDHRVSVINPCTGESRRIPEESFFERERKEIASLSPCLHGFGYASMSDDYKLVKIDCGVVTIYSLRSDSWHRIEPACLARYHFPFGGSWELHGTLLNGALHWACVLEDDGNRKGLILAFDLEEETFREVSLPFLEEFLEIDQIDDFDIYTMKVAVLNGCLCVESCDELWLMREYNNDESWTWYRGHHNVCIKVLSGFDENGDALPEVNEEVTLCYFEDGTRGILFGHAYYLDTYVESLISPSAYVGRLVVRTPQRKKSPLCSVRVRASSSKVYSKSSLIFHRGDMVGNRKKCGRNQPREAVITAPHLPHEIVVLIISRLPVKSLCRFRCVSKSWFSTISTPQFAKTHLDLAFQNNTQSQKLIWFLDYGLRSKIYCVDWDSINDDDVRDKGLVAVELGHPLKDSPIFSRIHRIPHSSNGLLCVICDPSLSVINPCTGESRRIPEESFFEREEMASLSPCLHGFGYASMSDDYKLVKIDCGVVTIYSLRSDSWHRIEPACLARYHFPFGGSWELHGTLLNGALHWACVLEDDGNRKGLILAFDLEEETFREVSLPFLEEFLEIDQIDDFDIYTMKVAVLNGCLCVEIANFDDLWLMREYNNDESWTWYSHSGHGACIHYVCIKVLSGFDENGDALLEENEEEEVTLCYFEDGTRGILIGHACHLDTYVESLISPSAYVGR